MLVPQLDAAEDKVMRGKKRHNLTYMDFTAQQKVIIKSTITKISIKLQL